MIAAEVFRWIAFWLALSGAFVFAWFVFVRVCRRRYRGERLAGPESRARLPHAPATSVLTGGRLRRRDLGGRSKGDR